MMRGGATGVRTRASCCRSSVTSGSPLARSGQIAQDVPSRGRRRADRPAHPTAALRASSKYSNAVIVIEPAALQDVLARWWFNYDEGNFDVLASSLTEDAHFTCRTDTGATDFEDFVR